MLPRGLDGEMMWKVMGKNYKENLKKLIQHSLVKVY